MRIPTRWWEADWMARSGFYTNRMRMTEMLGAFEAVGFTVADLRRSGGRSCRSYDARSHRNSVTCRRRSS